MKLSTFKLTQSTSNIDKILKEFNATRADYPRGKTILHLLEEQCKKNPHHIALVETEANQSLTYTQLSRRSNQLAHFLLDCGCRHRHEPVVGLLLDHSIEAIVCMIGILKAGGVYLPIAANTPFERIKFILNDTNTRFLISQKKYIKTINKLQWECPSLDNYLCVDSENVYQEEEEPNELMDRDLWDYIGKTAHDDISGGAWFSSYTGNDLTRQEMDEYANNILAKLRPYLTPGTRVLEIGCSTGLSMFRIAPYVGEYIGTDLSPVILDKTRARVRDKNLTNIKLFHLPAHQIHQLEQRDFDIVILNSVVQCFNGHNYFREVIHRCIQLLKNNGLIFLGDIQDQGSKALLTRDLDSYKKCHAGESVKTKTDWSHELFLSRAFFDDLQIEMPAIESITHSQKIGELPNELTRYRFDTLLFINKPYAPFNCINRPKTRNQFGSDTLVTYPRDPVPLRPHLTPRGAAYIIYTSGTTGVPKGCVVTHENIVRLMHNDKHPFDFNASDVWINAHAYNFDFSVWEIYGALLYGGRLVISRRQQVKDVEKFLLLTKKFCITVLNQTPLAFKYLADRASNPANDNVGTGRGRLDQHLRYVIFGGDRLDPTQLEQWISWCPLAATRLINMYGITETTVHVTFHPLTKNDILTGGNTSPIGKPLPETIIYILDQEKKLVPVGIEGELYVGGTGVCRGYLNRHQLTYERFIPNPYNPAQRIYSTGDMGKWNPDGTIQFLGRKDQQVKIRGFRIEPGEIAHHLSNHPAIAQAIVIAREPYQAREKELTAYFIPRQGTREIGIKDLRAYLSNRLPDYMVPALYVSMTEFPLTPNNKIDINALPLHGGMELKTGDRYRPPTNGTQRQLLEIWKRLLDIDDIGITDNYFNIGGDSIKAIRMVHLVNKELDANLEIADLYTNDTIERLSHHMNRTRAPVSDKWLKQASQHIESLKTTIMAQKHRAITGNIHDLYPMSDIEKGMVFHSRKAPAEALYHDQTVHFFNDSAFDTNRFRRAYALMVQKHPILRTAFNMEDFEEPIQIVFQHDDEFAHFHYIDISHLQKSQQEDYIKEFLNLDRQKPFDISGPSLSRLQLFGLGSGNICLVFITHHAIMDGWSEASLMTELYNTYIRLKTEPDFVPPGLKSTYKEFVIQELAEKNRPQTLGYWKRQLRDYKKLDFPAPTRAHETPTAPREKNYTSDLGTTLLNRLQVAARQHHTSVKHLCFGAYIYMLSMLSFDKDLVVGLVVNCRPLCPDGENILGCFLNTVPVCVKIPDPITWADYIQWVDKKTRELKKYDRLPFFEIIRQTRENPQQGNPLFDTIFNFVDFHVYLQLHQTGSQKQPGIELSVSGRVKTNTLFDLSIDTTFNNFSLFLSYSTALVDDAQVEQLVGFFTRVLEKFIHEPGNIARADQLIPQEEKRKILEEFNRTTRNYPRHKTIHELFEEQVDRTPDNIAVVAPLQIEYRTYMTDMTYISYQGLSHKSNQLAYRLKEKGAPPDTIIGIMAHRSIETVIGILGILKAGGVYMPIDPGYPAERIDYMLKDSGTRILLKKSEIRNPKSRCFQTNPNDRNSNDQNKVSTPIVLDFEHLNFEFVSNFEFRASNLNSSTLAYIMYTSGSTGQPRGVMVEHQGVVRLVINANYVELSRDTRILHTSAPVFDATTFEIWGALLNGGQLFFEPRDVILNARLLGEAMRRHRINLLWLTAPLFNQLEQQDSQLFSPLEWLLVGGDVLSCPHINQVRKSNPGLKVINGYGPTENTTFSTTYLIETHFDFNIPIGKPIGNSSVYILDRYLHVQPMGVVGELWAGGDGVARGYMNNPELTAEKFKKTVISHSSIVISSPSKLSTNDQCLMTNDRSQKFLPNDRLYKTGDLARWLWDGNIEFQGRLDHQVKIRGFRIELEEIQHQLLNYPGIQQAAVIVNEINGQKELAAFVKGHPPGDRLKQHLHQILPGYMVPSIIVHLEQMPLTPNGKLDRKALVQKARQGLYPIETTTYAAPANPIESQLVLLWQEVLGLEKIGIHHNFFDCGGHSLNAIQVISRVHKTMSVQISIDDLFKHPTIAGLARLIKEKEFTALMDIQPVEKQEYYDLSHAQRRLWVLHQFENAHTSYNIPAAFGLRGNLDITALEKAFQALIQRHDSLRTGFVPVGGIPKQKIYKTLRFDLGIHEISPGEPLEETLNQLTREHALTVFDLARPPLIKADLVKLLAKTRQFVLLLNIHHIISDGWSMTVFFNELILLYNAYHAGSPASTPAGIPPQTLVPLLPLQYKDYAAWQNTHLDTGLAVKQKEYWLNQFPPGSEIPVLEIPVDIPRPAVKTYTGDTHHVVLPPPLSSNLHRLCKDYEITLFMTLLASLNLLIYRYTQQEDIIIGTPTAGRNHPDLEAQVGFYVNTLALRNRVKGHEPVENFLNQVKQTCLQAYENQFYPFDRLPDELELNRDTSRNPLFDIMAALQNTGNTREKFDNIEIIPTGIENQFKTSKFDLTFIFTPITPGEGPGPASFGEIHLDIEYNTDLFKKERIQRVGLHFIQLVGSIVSDPRQTINHLDLLTAREKQELLNDFNDTAAAYSRDKTIHQLFEEQVERTPHHTAVVGVNREPDEMPFKRVFLTYRQFNEKTNQLAHYLRKRGVYPGTCTGVVLHRSIEMAAALMAILKAGAAYIPLETYLPDTRVRDLLGSLDIEHVITDTQEYQRIREIGRQLPRLNHIVVLGEGDFSNNKEIQDQPRQDLPPLAAPGDAAYIIFTSGSSGVPKGVVETHRPVINVIEWVNREFRISTGHQLLFITSPGFDLSVYDIFGILAAGATLRAAAGTEIKDPQRLLEIIIQESITFWDSAPAALQQLVPFLPQLENKPSFINPLQLVFLSGDWIPVALPGVLKKAFAGVSVISLGGATEATIWSNYYPINEVDPAWTSIPYGKPIQNAKYYILDSQMQPCAVGIPGNLYIGGECLASGYKNDLELTRQKFIPNPYRHREIIYKTGDMARWYEDGSMEFLGRLDHQVKIRGFRVELGEIEYWLAKHPDIKQAVVTAKDFNQDMRTHRQKELAAFVVGKKPVNGRQYLSQYLPDYMIPTYFISMEKLPVTPNGKIDRKALQKIDIKTRVSRQVPTAYVPPRTGIETTLVQVWKEVLARETIGITDNFFEIGGDSIKAIQVAAGLHQYSLELKISDLFSHPTIQGLAPRIGTGKTAVTARQDDVEGKVELTPIQREFFHDHLKTPHYFNQAVMIYSSKGFEETVVAKTFQHLVRHHDALRMVYEPDLNPNRVLQRNQGTRGTFFHLDVFTIPGTRAQPGDEIEKIANQVQGSIDIARGPLVKLALFKTLQGDHLLIVIHHLVVDGVSWRILLEDFSLVYRQLENNQPVKLPPKTTSFKEWARGLTQYALDKKAQSQLAYWQEIAQTPHQPLPKDFIIEKSKRKNKYTRTIHFQLDETQTRQLLQTTAQFYHAEINDILLTALAMAVQQWAGLENLLVNLESHGRQDILERVNTSRTIGWFTAQFPVLINIDQSRDLNARVRATRRSLKAVPQKGVGYGILKYLSQLPQPEKLNPTEPPEICFNYLGQFDNPGDNNTNNRNGQWFTFSPFSTGNSQAPEMETQYSLNIGGMISNRCLQLFISYNTYEYRQSTIENAAGLFRSYLEQLSRAPKQMKDKKEITGETGVEEENLLPRGKDEKIIQLIDQECILLNRKHDRKVFFFPPLLGLALSYLDLAERLDNSEISLYGFDFIERPGRLYEYLDYITDIQPSGPYILGSHSTGNLAFEVAKELEQLGKKVTHLVLIDAVPTPGKQEQGEQNQPPPTPDQYKDLVDHFSTSLQNYKYKHHLNVSAIINRVSKKVRNYGYYVNNHPNHGRIHATLHYIKASDTTDEYNRWNPLTSGKIKVYPGFGKHRDMLGGENLEKNAALIKKIILDTAAN